MSIPAPTGSPSRTLAGPAALRSLAKAFGHIADFRPFVEMLEVSLGKAAFFDRAQISLTHGEAPPPDGFVGGQFTLPITGAEALHGVLKVASPGRVFGSEDLHLLASLASVLAAVLDHAKRHGETRKNLEVLNFLLNLAPVGMIAADAEGAVLASNDIANRWLGAANRGELAEKLKPETLGADWRTKPSFHVQVGGRLLYVESRAYSTGKESTSNASTAYGLVFADLAPEQTRLVDALQREIYRSRWLSKPLTFVLAQSAEINGGVLQRLPELRAALHDDEMIGPDDAFNVGLILPGLDEAGALARLRELQEKFPTHGVRFGLAATSGVGADAADNANEGGGVDATAMIEKARGALRASSEVLRRTLLLHDDYPAVNDMLELALGRRFHIVKSTRLAETRELLRTRTFDGLFTEVELRNGGSGIDLARYAKELQPRIRPYFTTVAHTERLPGLEPLLADHVVLRKPFDLQRLDEAVRATLA